MMGEGLLQEWIPMLDSERHENREIHQGYNLKQSLSPRGRFGRLSHIICLYLVKLAGELVDTKPGTGNLAWRFSACATSFGAGNVESTALSLHGYLLSSGSFLLQRKTKTKTPTCGYVCRSSPRSKYPRARPLSAISLSNVGRARMGTTWCN